MPPSPSPTARLARPALTFVLSLPALGQSPAWFDAAVLHEQADEFSLLADVDGDGDSDALAFTIVAQSLAKTQARVYWNDGSGNLSAGPALALPADSGRVGYADVDGDGRGDLLVGHAAGTTPAGLRVYPGLPGGQFAAPIFLQLPSAPQGLGTGDANGDGIADVCVLCSTGGAEQLRWYAGDPARQFPLGTPLTLSLEFRSSLVVLDADLDGDADVALLNASSNQVEIVLSTGLVASAGPVLQLGPSSYYELTVVDVDSDGDQDLVTPTTNFGVTSMQPLLQQPGGAWSVIGSQLLGSWPGGVLFARDWDGDGDEDLLLRSFTQPSGNRFVHTLAWFCNQAGSFPIARSEQLFGSEDLSLGAGAADLDGDGWLDFVDARALRFGHAELLSQPLPGPNRPLRDWDDDGDLDGRIESTQTLAKNDGTGVFTVASGFWPNAGPNQFFGTPIAVADFDGDGLQEALVPKTLQQAPLPPVFLGMHRLEANGDDLLLDQGLACPTQLTTGLALDADGDGDLDVVTSQGVVVQQSPGSFVLVPQSFAGHSPVAVGDLDGDGDEDLLAASSTLGLSALLRTAPSTFTWTAIASPSGNTVIPVFATLADLDDDGDLDLAAARHSTPFGTMKQVEVFANVGGVFTPVFTVAADGRPLAGDVDGDGTTDLLVATIDTAHLLRRTGPGFTYAPALRFSHFGGFALADLDLDGDLDLFGQGRLANRRFEGPSAGSRRQYGSGGLGSGGRRPLLSVVGTARPGATVELRVRHALGGAAAVLAFGDGAMNVPNFLPGITGYVDNVFALVQVPLGGSGGTPGAGTLDAPLPIPVGVAMVDLYLQVVVFDPVGTAGLVHGNAVALHVGS